MDDRLLGGRFPFRNLIEYSVREKEDGRALIEALGVIPPSYETRSIWDVRRFRLESLPRSEDDPPSNLADPGREPMEQDRSPTYFDRMRPWQAPIVSRATQLAA